jgi:Zn-dependent peptidase ImmA (M78 family)/transcriptional regulator with XRE-family HTH domain
MPITQEQLAKRLKAERNRLELTQEEVAERMGVKRPTIAQIEAGNRAITSIELSQFAEIYKREVESLLSEKEPEDAAGLAHLRTSSDLDETVRYHLDKCIEVCKAATELEKLLGISQNGVGFSYTLERPQSRWEAVEQGIRLAMMERKRLELGTLPVRNIVEIIAQHGVRVGRYTLTEDISGLFFVGPDTGKAILVNMKHTTTRRLFSYAHEYMHLLVDSQQTPGGVSRYGNRDDLFEVRANAFAAHFLMPNEGVRAFLNGLGGPTRQVMEVYDGFQEQAVHSGEDLLTAQRRAAPGSQEVRLIDALRVARHFGTSYIATVYQLLNLKIIHKETQEQLLASAQQAEQVNDLLGVQPLYLEQEEQADLKQMTVNLTVEAWLQELISRPKAYEYTNLLGLDPHKLDSLNIMA